MKYFPWIDIMKYPLALLVLSLHLGALIQYKDPTYVELMKILSVRVQFFFMATGFLVGLKVNQLSREDGAKKMLKTFWRFIKLFARWIVFYLPFLMAFHPETYFNDQPLTTVAGLLKKLLIDGELPYAWPLWYLYSCAMCMLLFSWLGRTRWSRVVLMLAGLALYGIISAKGHVMGMDLTWLTTYTKRTLGGLPFIGLGMVVADNYHRKPEIGNLSLGLMTGTLIAVAIGMYVIIDTDYWRVAAGLALFVFAVYCKIPIKRSTRLIRQQATWIYLIHMAILICIVMILPASITTNFPVLLIIAMATVAVVAYSLTQWSQHQSGKWLTKLT